MTKTKAAWALSVSAVLCGTGCGDEGVTYVAGPFPVPSMDASISDATVSPDASDQLPPCPASYTCADPAAGLASMGLQGTVTDPAGNPVPFSCVQSAQEPCNLANPAASCPNFSMPFCAHIKLTALGIEFDQCAQKCSP